VKNYLSFIKVSDNAIPATLDLSGSDPALFGIATVLIITVIILGLPLFLLLKFIQAQSKKADYQRRMQQTLKRQQSPRDP